MMQVFDPVSYNAFARLLAQPDPADLPRRAHTVSCEGGSTRRVTRLPAILMAWLQRRHLESEIEEPLAPALRSWKRPTLRPSKPRLQFLRPTGTC